MCPMSEKSRDPLQNLGTYAPGPLGKLNPCSVNENVLQIVISHMISFMFNVYSGIYLKKGRNMTPLLDGLFSLYTD